MRVHLRQGVDLAVAPVVPEQRVGEGIAGVERVVGVHGEVVLAGEGSGGGEALAFRVVEVLEVEAALESGAALDPGEVVVKEPTQATPPSPTMRLS